MSIKPIRLFGDPVLRTPAEPVRDFDAELRRLVKDLTDTMLDAPGVGLAAPQIGVGLRVFTYHVDDNEPGHLINPVLDLSKETEEDDEGCLSFPGLVYPVPRAWGVVAKGVNMYGDPVTIEGTELLARAAANPGLKAAPARPTTVVPTNNRRVTRKARLLRRRGRLRFKLGVIFDASRTLPFNS